MMTPFTVGEYVIFTSGSYSDYGIDALAVVVKEFDPDQLPLVQQNLAWLSKNGYVEELAYREFF